MLLLFQSKSRSMSIPIEPSNRFIGKLKKLSPDHLDKLSTKNLLAYYRAERIRYFKFENSQKVAQDVFRWEIYKDDAYLKPDDRQGKALYEEWGLYLHGIKYRLGQRENLEKV